MITGSWNHRMGAWIVGEYGTEIVTFSASGTNPSYYGEPVEVQKIQDREFCEYCHGYTKADNRGNCIACGAPKPFHTLFVR